jgi:hypothetical protein
MFERAALRWLQRFLLEERDALVTAAATSRWAKLYPSDQAAASVGSEAHLALGLLNPVCANR